MKQLFFDPEKSTFILVDGSQVREIPRVMVWRDLGDKGRIFLSCEDIQISNGRIMVNVPFQIKDVEKKGGKIILYGNLIKIHLFLKKKSHPLKERESPGEPAKGGWGSLRGKR